MDASEELIFGRHPVLAALKGERPLQRLLVAHGAHGENIDEIFALARARHIPYDLRERAHLDRLAGPAHQGVIAFPAARSYAEYGALLESLDSAAFLVFLDSVQDPHNVGAILRSAHALGADGMVLPERGAAGLSGAAVKAAAGAAEHLPVCRVANLQKALIQAREVGLWIYGLDAEAEERFDRADFRRPCALVIGSEGRGLRRLVRERCDALLHIPMARAQVGSLNASVAAGIVFSEVLRQRRAG